MRPMDATPPIDYHRMRLSRFRALLLDFARRWSIQCAVAAALFGAGSNAPLTIVAALPNALLVPMCLAAEQGWWVVPALVGYALVGALPVVMTRRLWWPRHWADAERALPIPPDTLRRSDRRFAAMVSSPWQALLLIGAVDGIVHRGADASSAVAGLVVAASGSWALAVRWMRFVRRHSRSRGAVASRPRGPLHRLAVRESGATRALLVLPMRRGRATRTATALVVGILVTTASSVVRGVVPIPVGWWLALLAVLSLVATSVLTASTRHELQPLWREHRELPMDSRACERARSSLILIPVLAGLAVATITALGEPIRLPVFTAYCAVLASGCAIEAITPETMEPMNHAARWVLMLSLFVAFGSEVAPG